MAYTSSNEMIYEKLVSCREVFEPLVVHMPEEIYLAIFQNEFDDAADFMQRFRYSEETYKIGIGDLNIRENMITLLKIYKEMT